MTDPYARYTRLKFDRPHAKVLRITMENGRMNTTDEALHRELGEIWRDIDRDASVNAAIITGAGRIFSAGGDFAIIRQNIEDFAARARQWKEARDMVYNVINCSKPVVSAMRGVAVGAGLVCGLLKAKYYLLLCDEVLGEEAERIGLISLAVEDADLDAKAVEIAGRLAEGAQSAIRWTKYALNNWLRAMGPTFDTSLALEMLGFGGPEIKEGLASHLEKRRPAFPSNSPL